MSEMLFVEVLRRYVEALPAGRTGWLAGLRDPSIERVCALLHERFVHFIGQPPMQYLTQWRMQVASRRLRDTSAKIIEVVLGVGYESEAAFSLAFKRVVGVAPARGGAGLGRLSSALPSE